MHRPTGFMCLSELSGLSFASILLMTGRNWLWHCFPTSRFSSLCRVSCHPSLLSYASSLSFLFFPPALLVIAVDFSLTCCSSSLNAAHSSPLSLVLSPLSLSHRQGKDVSVIKTAGANGGISPYADSLHHWTDRWIPHTDTLMWAHPHVNTHTHMQTCNINGRQLKWMM